MAGNLSVATTPATQKLYVDTEPANRLFLDETTVLANNSDLAFSAYPWLDHKFTRMPASRAAATNARRAISAGPLPELTSEHA